MEPLPQITRKEPKPLSPDTVALCVLVGIVVPLICFGTATNMKPFAPDWQSGEFRAYVGFMFDPGVFVAFVPLMVYAAVSLAFAAANLPAHGGKFVVRFGLATGVLLALQYEISFCLCLEGDPPLTKAALLLAAGLVPLALFGVWVKVRDWLGWRMALLYVIAVVAAGVMVLAYLAPRSGLRSPSELGGGAFILTLFAGPAWALTLYCVLTLWTLRRVPAQATPGRLRALVAGGWTAVYAAAWYYAIATIAEKYSKLPTSPPSRCYVATAASRGHARLVGARPVRCADGSVVRMNAQTRTLKCAEIILREACPRTHRLLRRIYDALGPALAARLTHPLLADAAYLSLKPFEWFARGVARLFVRG